MSVTVSRAARLGLVLLIAAIVVALLPSTSPTKAVASAPDYNLSHQTYPDGRSVVARWNPCQRDITYRVNTKYAAKTKAGRIKALKDVKKAAARLSLATGIKFRYVGTSTSIPKNVGSKSWADRETGAEIYIAWVKQSSKAGKSNLLGRNGSAWAAGSGGYSYKFWKVGDEPWHGATGRGFVVLDAAQNKKFKSGFGSGTTRGDLLLHELGHVMGLNHVTESSEVMFPTIRSHHQAGYAKGDLEGLAKLGRQAGCLSVPNWVWKDLS